MQLSRASLVLLLPLVPTTALAQSAVAPTPCLSAQLHAELEGLSDWEAHIGPVRAQLRGSRVDPCARVDVRAQGQQVVVSVTSRERATSRTLGDPSELERTVEALVVLPPLIETSAERPPRDVGAKLVSGAEPTHVELAAGAAMRLGGNVYAGGGPALMADVVVDRYLLGISGRWDVAEGYVSEPTASGFSMESGAIGVLLGRRLDLGRAWLDVILEANVVVESEEGGGTPDEIGGETADVRAGLGARLVVDGRSRVHPYFLLDAEASPSRLTTPRQLDPALPTLPAWSTGLAVGLLWGPR